MIFDDEWKLQVKDKGYVISNDEFVFHTDEKTHMEKLVKLLGGQQSTIKQLEKNIKDLNFVINFQEKEIDGLKALLKEKECFEEAYYISKKENDNKFKFNVNQAKAYHIKSISPNGVVRTGKKNSKVSWRMKDVREISQELPSFEDFNRKTFMQMRNKFHKFDKDVFGRIIYNIYLGTFEEYI